MTATGATKIESARAGLDVVPLDVRDVTVRFGGVTALSEVSFRVEPGSLHAVIGPNGAGKSTLFNVLSGVYKATTGEVRLGDDVLTGLKPHKIASLGVARAFQNLGLFTGASVEENLLVGRHHLMRGGFLSGALLLPSVRREERIHRERVREIAEFLGIDRLLDMPVGDLPYGDRKRVELARALCMEPRILLLDEPVAGMNAEETRRIGQAIRSIRRALGISIVLVEHDMSFVMSLADRVSVLDFGRCVADGTPAEVREHPEVIRAYLGEVSDDNASQNDRED